MRTVRAEQLIFTRVEPAYSPQHKDGYQTVYKGKGLTPSEVEQIQKKIQCFQPKHPVDRQQFFMIDGGKVVLTYTVLIEGHPEIIDRNQRGAFIAHAFIFSQNEFGKTNYNPFIIFDQTHLFLEDAETMVKEFGQATGLAKPVNVSMDEHDQLDTNWPRDEWLKLVALAEQAEELLRNRKSLFLTGSEDSIRETLEAVFLLIPPKQRLHCSFDTHIDRCPTPPGIYWAAGGATRQSNNAFIQVLTQERRVASSVKLQTNQNSLYTQWLEQASLEDDMATLIDYAPTIQTLTESFATRRLITESLDEAACDSFFEIHTNYIRQRFKAALTKGVGKQLTISLADYLWEMMDTVDKLKVASSEKFPQSELATFVADWLVNEEAKPGKGDWKQLHTLVETSDNMRLLHLTTTLGKRNSKLRLQALQRMSAQEFQANLPLLCNPIAPADFVCKRHLKLLLSNDPIVDMTEAEFVALVAKIMGIDQQKQLAQAQLMTYIQYLDDGALIEIETLLKQYSAPSEFITRVEEHRQDIGPPGVINKVKSTLVNSVKKVRRTSL